jgi:colanic acid/amylovoran biosynthesis glycosyltransferase
VCSPSRTAADGDAESLLLVNLEAQACGRPVVTTRHAAVPEFVDEERTALVVPESDPVALADALVAVLRDRALAERLGAAGPAFAQRFEVGACARRIDDEVYLPLLGVKG